MDDAALRTLEERSRREILQGRGAEPSAEERAVAVKVLRFYQKLADNLLAHADQEYPAEVARGLEVSRTLLKAKDPAGQLVDYLVEYRLGHVEED